MRHRHHRHRRPKRFGEPRFDDAGHQVRDATNPEAKSLEVAIAGNPNAGKTTVFNALTGQHQHVGNYPGVTVDKKTGYALYKDWCIHFVDLPGTYSLSAYSIEEVVARDFVIRDQPDLIVDVLDATNLKRNLYLLLQLMELGVPVIGALNMADEVEKLGITIDEDKLSVLLGVPFVKTVGNRGLGIEQLLELIVRFAEGELKPNLKRIQYSEAVEAARNEIGALLASDARFTENFRPDWTALKLLEEDADAVHKVESHHSHAQKVLDSAAQVRQRMEKNFREPPSIVIGEQRYAFIHGITHQAVKKVPTVQDRFDITERIDRVVLNKYGGVFIFLFIMFLVYQFTFALGNPLSDWIGHIFAIFGGWVQGVMPAGFVRDLIVDGIIGGVGGVLVFFPLVMLLFLGLSFLEDTGYMARAAFVMDKFFQIFGLHGRSFIPFMIATGCAVPAVMSARTLSNLRDRTITIMVVPLMICGAKSPVIAMLAAAFFPAQAGAIFWLVWFISWLLAVTIALILTKVMFKGKAAPFVMELPPYRMPTWRGVFNHMWGKSLSYIRKAGTIILAASVVIWFLLAYPKPEQSGNVAEANGGAITDATGGASVPAAVEAAGTDPTTKHRIEFSYAGRFGHMIEPAIKPAGFDWRIGVGLFAGVAAKEVIISTMGMVYGIGEDDTAAGGGNHRPILKEVLAKDPAYSPAMALAMMIFVMIYLPCISVLAVVKKELGSWLWPLFQAVYTLVVAWVLAVATYQAGILIGLG